MRVRVLIFAALVRPRIAVRAVLLGCVLSGPAAAQTLDYGIFEGMFDEPVTDSATGKPERISDTPVTMDVLTADDIRRSGARDLAALLRTLPGISSYRGFNGTEEFSIGALFLNGREIYLTTFGDMFLPSIPVELEEIRQIEVIRGPQSALYGFNSGEGVINIITFDPSRDPVDSVNARIGNDGRRDASAIYTQSLGKDMGLRLSAAGDHAGYHEGAYDTAPNRYANDPDRTSLAANFSAVLDNGDRATAEVSHSDISVTSMAPQIAAMVNTRLQTDSVRGTYAADTVLGRITAGGFYTAQTIPQAQTQTGGSFNLHDHTIDGKVSDLFKAGTEDSLRFDVEYRYEIVHTSDTQGSLSTGMLVGSAMWDHQFGHDWSLVNAVKYYRNVSTSTIPMPMTGSEDVDYGFAYNSALIYKLSPDDSLRAAVSRGIALPSQLDFETLGLGPIIGQKIALTNDPNLSRSSSEEYRVGWDHQLRDLDAMARVSLFTKQSVNAVALIPVQIVTLYNPACVFPVGPYAALCNSLANTSVMSGVFDGAEVQIDHKSVDGWRWGANYTVEQLRPHANSSTTMLVAGLNNDQIFQKVNANLGYGWNRWTADLRLFYSSPVRSLALETVGNAGGAVVTQKSILSLSPHLSWMLRDDLTLDLAAENLWPYRENLVQKMPATFFFAAHYKY
jgi:outer membrane receptor for ferrienterochelin and colicins